MRRCSLPILVLAAALKGQPPAQNAAELSNRITALEDRIKEMETELLNLKAQQAAPQAPAVIAPAGGAAASKALNPDTSVIGDFIAASGNPASRPTPSLEM